VLGLDARAQAGLVSLLAPSGSIDALVSVEARDGLGDLDGWLTERSLGAKWSELGFELTEIRPARPSEVEASGSSWARRLGAVTADRRRVTRLRLCRLP
jgi:hypothetical protein